MRVVATTAVTVLLLASCGTHVPATDEGSFEVCEQNIDQVREISRSAATKFRLEIRTTPAAMVDGDKIFSEYLVRADSDEHVMYSLYNGSTFLYRIYGQRFDSTSEYLDFRSDVVDAMSKLEDICR